MRDSQTRFRFTARRTMFAFLALAACRVPEPGTGELAELGFARAAPVITALEAYKDEQGTYPPSLAPLVPRYLPQLPQDADGLDFSYGYREDTATYELEFMYAPGFTLGVTECSYGSDTKRWSCGSYV